MDVDERRFPLIYTIGSYDKAYGIIKNQPKCAIRYNPKCYKFGYLKIQNRKLYASDGRSRYLLWDVWGNAAEDWESGFSLKQLRKEVITYAVENNLSNGMRLKP